MYINEQYRKADVVNTIKAVCRNKGVEAEEEIRASLLSEHLLEVFVNGRLTMKLVCVAEYLAELALGRLLSEGLIREAQEVESVYICESGGRAKIFLKDRGEGSQAAEPFVETTPSCCTGNHILDRRFIKMDSLRKISPIPWEPEWIFRLEEEFAQDTPLHRETSATHSCFLAQKGETLIRCEDIGRHNALDKVIGYGLRHGIDLGQSVVYSSGRIPTDMAVKAIRAGIPVLASKESPTQEAVELARQHGLTLLCNAKNGKFNQYV